MSARWRSFWLAEIGVSLILILVAIGLWLDWRAFVVNIVAGLAIVVVGVFVTFAVLDRLEAAFRRRRWERVRVLTVRSLCTHLSDIVNDFSAGLSKTLFSKGAFGMGRDRPDRTALEAFQSFLSAAEKHNAAIVDEYAQTDSDTRPLYNFVSRDMGVIRDVLAPRVMSLADDVELVERLAELEIAENGWFNALWVSKVAYDRAGTIVAAIEFRAAVVAVYRALCNASATSSRIA